MGADRPVIPEGVIPFGSNTNCNLDVCPVEWSLYGYRPSREANYTFVALFTLLGILHVILGVRWKSWGFMVGMILGSLCEVIGYVGRIMLWTNPFHYKAFMIQIICLTIAPVFYTASIYMTLAKAVTFFAADLSRFPPKYFTWIFLPADLICLVLQAAGGAMSNSKKSAKIQQTGLDISKAGLILQVVVLVLFIAAFVDFIIRYYRSGRMMTLNWRIKAFVSGLFSSIFIILVRCVYRVVELREGYHGEMMKHEAPFIALEGAAVVLAAACLLFCHPGMVFQEQQRVPSRSKESDSEGSGTYKGPHVMTHTHNV